MACRVNMFWVGSHLGKVHVACIRSFLRMGHQVLLHCYDAPLDLPRGVLTFDASRLISEQEMEWYRRSGNIALGSDRYRYLLIEAGFGIYCDCDFFCLNGIDEENYIMGLEDKHHVNGAILNYPSGSDLSRFLLETTSSVHDIPPSLNFRRKTIAGIRKAIGFPQSVEKHPWGVWGPRLITHAVAKLDLWAQTSAIDVYYPLHYNDTQRLFERGTCLRDITTGRTRAIHLWNKMSDKREPPDGSILAEILNA